MAFCAVERPECNFEAGRYILESLLLFTPCRVRRCGRGRSGAFLFTSVRGLLPVGALDPPLKIAAACRLVGHVQLEHAFRATSIGNIRRHRRLLLSSIKFGDCTTHLGLGRAPILTRLFLLLATPRPLTVFSPHLFLWCGFELQLRFSKGLHSIAECTPSRRSNFNVHRPFPGYTVRLRELSPGSPPADGHLQFRSSAAACPSLKRRVSTTIA